jgi:hypothetical protein
VKEEMKASPPQDLGAKELHKIARDAAKGLWPGKGSVGQNEGIILQAIQEALKLRPLDLGTMLVELAERDGFEKGRQFWFMQDGMLVFVHSTNECKPNEPLAAVKAALEEGK